jgi:hypothetical protein
MAGLQDNAGACELKPMPDLGVVNNCLIHARLPSRPREECNMAGTAVMSALFLIDREKFRETLYAK